MVWLVLLLLGTLSYCVADEQDTIGMVVAIFSTALLMVIIYQINYGTWL